MDGGNKVDALVFKRQILSPLVRLKLTTSLEKLSPRNRVTSAKFRLQGMKGPNPNTVALATGLFNDDFQEKLRKGK